MFFKTLILLCLVGGIATTSLAQTAQFTADKTTGCFPLTVNFTDQSTGTVTSWSWNLGNGNSSAAPNPSAIYTSPGTYTVSLTINGGADTETKTGYIIVRDFPEGDFTFNKTSGCAPLEVSFTNQVDLSSGNITKWQWVFGDGGTSDQANPSYVYTAPGERTISLVVTNEYGCETTISKASAIDVNGPLVDFTPDVFTACQVPQTIAFTNQTQGEGTLTYSWDFGDGNTGTAINPSHTYTQSGHFAIKLTATDGHGCKADHIEEITIGQESGLDFLASASQLCIGETVTFTTQSSENIVSLNWDFGNGTSSSNTNPTIAYDKAGSYVVTLTAQLQGKACQSSATRTITVVENALPSFSSSVDCESVLTLTNTSTHATRIQWYIDKSLISSQNSITYPASPGNYIVKLIAFNNLDCPTVLEKTVYVPNLPVAAFSPSVEQSCKEASLSGCAPFSLQFENESISDLSFTSEWSLGEGVTSTAKDPPLRTFSNAGNYNIRLIITDSRNCKDTVEAVVRVADSPPTAAFNFDKNNVCVGEQVNFSDQSQGANFLCWDFGDGTFATGQNVKHAYGKSGVYTVTLTAKNAGCTDVFQIQNAITVKAPDVDFAISKSCDNPFEVHLINLSQNAHIFHWDLGNGISSSQKDAVYTYPSTGVFSIKLTAESNTTQCAVEIEKFVTIQQIKADFTLENTRPCRNIPVFVADESKFASTWEWIIDDELFSNAQSIFFRSDVPGAHTLKLLVTDSDGCQDEKATSVTVPDIAGRFSFSATSDCEAFTVDFTDASTANPPLQSWTWDFGDGATSDDQHPQHVYNSTGEFTVKLTLSNGVGECDFIKEDEVVFSLPVPDFSVADANVCIGEPITIANTSQNAVSYSWELGNGITSTAISPQYSYNATGSYDITLHAKDEFGCEVSLTKNDLITVGQPTADFEAFQTSGECPPLTSVFSDKSTGSDLKWYWNFGNGATSSLQHPTNVYNRPGVYGVSLRVEDDHGCFDIKTIDSLIHVGGPSGSFAPMTNSVCMESEVEFTATTSNTTIYRWDFGDGYVIDSPNNTVEHTYNTPGVYHPALVLIDDQGCNVTADGSGQFVVKNKPALKFDFGPECIFASEILTLNTDAEDLTLQWYINGEALGDENYLEIQMDSAGVYNVTLAGTNDIGCTSELTEAVYVHGAIKKIPNVFTPNGDATNQFFVLEGAEKSSWSLHLFNRWGKEIMTREHYSNNWDGEDIPSGVYFYTVTNERCPSRTYKGYVQILK